MTACGNPIPYETLVDLWAGALSESEAARVDEHLFACDLCAGVSEQLGDLIGTLRELVPPVISHAQRDRLIARGLRIQVTDCTAGRDAEAFFAADLDLLVHVLHGDLAGVDRVDVAIVDRGGRVFLELPHVPFDASRGEVLIACQRHYRQLEAMAEGDPIFRVTARAGGTQRVVGDYLVRHRWPD